MNDGGRGVPPLVRRGLHSPPPPLTDFEVDTMEHGQVSRLDVECHHARTGSPRLDRNLEGECCASRYRSVPVNQGPPPSPPHSCSPQLLVRFIILALMKSRVRFFFFFLLADIAGVPPLVCGRGRWDGAGMRRPPPPPKTGLCLLVRFSPTLRA